MAGTGNSVQIGRPAGIILLAAVQLCAALSSLIGVREVAAAGPRPFVVVLFAAAAALLACGAYGLWTLRPYGRAIPLMLAWIGLAAFPGGTILSIPVLHYLFKPSTRVLFSGKPAEEPPADPTLAVSGGGAFLTCASSQDACSHSMCITDSRA